MTTTPEQQTEPTEKTSRAPVFAALGVLGLVLVIAFGSQLFRDDTMWSGSKEPTNAGLKGTTGQDQAVELSLPAETDARCMPVEAQTLKAAETAFDGEVLSRTGSTVTFAVRQWYAGGSDAAEVRLDVAKVPTSLSGYFDFQDGKRYLVSANDDVVRVCGFSGPWTSQLERVYTDAFGG